MFSLNAIAVPFWAVVLAFATLPAVDLVRKIRSRRKRWFRLLHGLCQTCGYDLRATPDRCPECGAIPPK
jgi:predicted Zn-ribbon and HTH transcriptional regulator